MQLTKAQKTAQRADLNEFKNLLKQQPEHTEFSQEGEYYYIPISYLEQDLNAVFDWVQFEIKEIQELINTITVSVRLKVLHPVLGEWLNYDGAATIALGDGKYQGTTAMIKPGEEYRFTSLAIAFAKQNAAKSIGPRFGANLNREITPESKTAFDVIPFDLTTIKTKLDVLKAIAGGHITKEQGDEIISNGYDLKMSSKDQFINLKTENINEFNLESNTIAPIFGNQYIQGENYGLTLGSEGFEKIQDSLKKNSRSSKKKTK